MKRKIREYISLKEASQISDLTSDHLGLLIRKGKLGGKKIGRDYFTNKSSLFAYKSAGIFLTVDASFFQKQICFLKIFFSKNALLKISITTAIILLSSITSYYFFFGKNSNSLIKNYLYKASGSIKDAIINPLGGKTNANEKTITEKQSFLIYEIINDKDDADNNQENSEQTIVE